MRIRRYIISGLALLLVPPIGGREKQSISIEQTTQGAKRAAEVVESFDGIGDSFGAPPFSGQRFTGRLATDPAGPLTMRESRGLRSSSFSPFLRGELRYLDMHQ